MQVLDEFGADEALIENKKLEKRLAAQLKNFQRDKEEAKKNGEDVEEIDERYAIRRRV